MNGHTEAVERENQVDLAEFSLYFSSKSPQPMVAVEGKTHIVRYVNNAFEQLAHVNRSRLINRPFDDAVPEGKDNKCLGLLDRVFSTANAEVLLEQEHSSFDPPVYWSYSVWPIMDRSGQYPVGVMIQITGATEAVMAKKALMQLSRELEFKNKEMESFISIVTHDLRAPIVNIQGFSHEVKLECQTLDKLLAPVHMEQTLEKELDTILHKSIPESLSYIETSSEAMSNLVKTLVEVTKVGMSPLKPERIDMDKLINQVIDSIKIKFKEADVHFDLSKLPDCHADRAQVTQIFTNLVDNAVKYLDPTRPSWICIEGTLQADGVLYSVSDSGIGISIEQQEKIFKPYYQLNEKAAGGVGMGLATVKKLVERNNGKIWVLSEKGQYSIFYIALPTPPLQ